MLAGLRAIQRVPVMLDSKGQPKKEPKKYQRKVRSLSNVEIIEHQNSMLSTIVEMAVNGASVLAITEATDVSKSHVFKIKEMFGLIRPSSKDNVQKLRDTLIAAPDYTYQLTTLAEASGVSKLAIPKLIDKIAQVERGTIAGYKNKYRYNHDIKCSGNLNSCGRVLKK